MGLVFRGGLFSRFIWVFSGVSLESWTSEADPGAGRFTGLFFE